MHLYNFEYIIASDLEGLNKVKAILWGIIQHEPYKIDNFKNKNNLLYCYINTRYRHYSMIQHEPHRIDNYNTENNLVHRHTNATCSHYSLMHHKSSAS